MKKLLFVLLIILLTMVGFLIHKQNNVTSHQTINTPQVIDSKLIYQSLEQTGQIIGLKSTIQKQFTYTNSNFWGRQSYTFVLNGTFSMGYDINELIKNTYVDGNEIKIKIPKINIMSIDIPFDQMFIGKDVSLLRKELTDQEKQLLYGEFRVKIINQIVNDKEIEKQANDKTQQIVDSLLKVIPNVQAIFWY